MLKYCSKVSIFIGFLWVFTAFDVSAQLFVQTVKGRVTDAETQQPLRDVTVSVQTTAPSLGAVTEQSGHFVITNVPIGRHRLVIKRLGYEEATINELLVTSSKQVELQIKLTEQFQKLEEVVVKAQKEQGTAINDMATVSVRSFSVEQTKRYAATWNDPARMALSFAGTSSVDDQSNEIVIRGNSPKGLLWRMEGIEIPNPTHFSNEGASGGGISALSVNVLGNSDFFTGAFPAEYGNAFSGVFDIKLRAGNQDKREHTIQLGFQGVDFATEGPFSKKSRASYLVNYRYSTLGILDKIGIRPIKNALPIFSDAVFKIQIPMQKMVFSLWGMGGQSESNNTPVDNQISKDDSRFFSSGLNVVYYPNEKSYWENIVSASGNQIIDKYSQINTGYDQDRDYRYNYLRYSTLFNHKFNNQHTIRVGGVLSQINFDVRNVTRFVVSNKPQEVVLFDDTDQTHLLQAYAQWKFRISPWLSLNTGLHYVRLLLNDNASVEPRIGLKFQINERHSLNAGAGVHSRMDGITTYMMRVRIGNESVQANRNLQLPKSRHWILGYEYRLNADWRINTEGYFQQQYDANILSPMVTNPSGNLPMYSSLNDLSGFPTAALASDGTGQSRGVELTIEKFLIRGFYALSTTSLFKATYKGRDGIERNSRFDNGFVQNLLMGKEWAVSRNKKNLFGLNLKTTWAGGLRTTPINLAESIKRNAAFYDYSQSFALQLPHFFRIDGRLSYIINRAKWTSTFSLDVQNVTNRQNPQRQYYSNKQVLMAYQMGLIPIFNYRVEF